MEERRKYRRLDLTGELEATNLCLLGRHHAGAQVMDGTVTHDRQDARHVHQIDRAQARLDVT